MSATSPQEVRQPAQTGRYLEDADLLAALDRVSDFDGDITLIVGAGSSVEAALPGWDELVRTLLLRAGAELGLDGARLTEWAQVIEAEGLLAGGAVAKALAGTDEAFRDRLRGALYGDQPATSYIPQALGQQVAWLKSRLGSSVRIVTGNYDGLLEQALRDAGLTVHSYIQSREEPPGSAAVYHLHGRLIPGYPRTGRLVLAEDDYARVQDPGAWQERFMREALGRNLCVFVGLSLRDPNLIRWLYRYSEQAGQRRHLAVFVRQASPELGAELRPHIERATRERWGRCGVDVVWTDFFGEVAQFLHEIALRRSRSRLPVFAERARQHLQAGRALLIPNDPDAFRRAQDRISDFLALAVEQARDVAASGGADLGAEQLGLGVWGVDHAAGTVALWATSDRRFNDPAIIAQQRQPFEYDSRWIAVQAVTRGVVVQRDPDVYVSRWRLIRGIPIIVERRGGAGRVIVGALTLTSTTPAAESRLNDVEPGTLGRIDQVLSRAVARFFEV